MSDIFRISDANDIKLTGGVQRHTNCSVIDTRDANTITCLEAGAQNCGGNDPGGSSGGISSVYVGDCLSGSGTVDLPIEIVLNPTGGISCGVDGLYISNVVVVTGVTDTQVYTQGCISGSGTLANPLSILLNPTGGIQCTAAGLAVQFPAATGLNNVTTSSACLTGNGTAGSPLTILFNPTGGIQCTSGGVALQNTYLTNINTSGCLSGLGTAASPARVLLNPTGGIQCTAAGLAVQFPTATGLNNVSTSGACLVGNGTAGSPLAILLNPTGGVQCTAGGLAVQFPTATGLNNVSTTGCLSGNGTVGSPLAVLLNPTGGIQCTVGGLAINTASISSVTTAGCVSGVGTSGNPIVVLLNPTGGIQCTSAGLAINMALVASSGSGGCIVVSSESGTAPTSPTQPTTPMTNLSSGNIQLEFYNNVINVWFYNGSGFVLDKVFSGGGGSGSGIPNGDAGDIIVTGNGSGLNFDSGVVTAFSRTLLDDSSQSAWRTTLGLGTAATTASTDYAPAVHNHNASEIVSGVLNPSRLASGTPTVGSYVSATGWVELPDLYVDSTTLSGSGTSGSPLTVKLDPAGNISSGPDGLYTTSSVSGSDYFMGETNDGNSGSSITISFTTRANHKLTLTNNCALTFTAPASARETKIRFVQGGSGGYTITLPSGTLGDTPVLPTGVGSQSVVRFYYDGDGSWHV